MSDFLFKRGLGKRPGAVLNTAPGFLRFGDALCGARERSEEVTQLIAQDERPLPALAGFEISVGDGLVDFRSADAGHRASFRNRKAFALKI